MQLSFTKKKNIRKNFGKLKESLSIPNLIEVQKNSYKQLTEFKEDVAPQFIKGFDRVFKSIFPIEDLNDKATLEYISYRLEKPKFDVDECIQRGLTYSSALKCNLRLVVYEINQETNTKDILSAKEQEVYMGEVPMMTNSGTFITNGVQRVVVNQMHRSPGVFFDHDKGKSHASGKLLFNCRVIPNRGSWLDFEFDVKDLLYFRIDRKKKILVSTLLLALGFNKSDIVKEFYEKETYTYDNLQVTCSACGILTIQTDPDKFHIIPTISLGYQYKNTSNLKTNLSVGIQYIEPGKLENFTNTQYNLPSYVQTRVDDWVQKTQNKIDKYSEFQPSINIGFSYSF